MKTLSGATGKKRARNSQRLFVSVPVAAPNTEQIHKLARKIVSDTSFCFQAPPAISDRELLVACD